MPFINVEMKSGRTREQRAAFAAAVTQAAQEHLEAKPEKVSIRFYDVDPGHLANAGKLTDEE